MLYDGIGMTQDRKAAKEQYEILAATITDPEIKSQALYRLVRKDR